MNVQRKSHQEPHVFEDGEEMDDACFIGARHGDDVESYPQSSKMWFQRQLSGSSLAAFRVLQWHVGRDPGRQPSAPRPYFEASKVAPGAC